MGASRAQTLLVQLRLPTELDSANPVVQFRTSTGAILRGKLCTVILGDSSPLLRSQPYPERSDFPFITHLVGTSVVCLPSGSSYSASLSHPCFSSFFSRIRSRQLAISCLLTSSFSPSKLLYIRTHRGMAPDVAGYLLVCLFVCFARRQRNL